MASTVWARFVLPYTIQNYLADQIRVPRFSTDLPEFVEAEKAIDDKIKRPKAINDSHSVDSIHKQLGHIMWDFVCMARTKKSLKTVVKEIQEVKKEFWIKVRISGDIEDLNIELEKALDLDDFIETGMFMARDGLNRNESCGDHFREEHQTTEGEALGDDANYSYIACWK
jgi:succinate dehydrogenase / fumarate reductase flavoprotein subunit